MKHNMIKDGKPVAKNGFFTWTAR